MTARQTIRAAVLAGSLPLPLPEVVQALRGLGLPDDSIAAELRGAILEHIRQTGRPKAELARD